MTEMDDLRREFKELSQILKDEKLEETNFIADIVPEAMDDEVMEETSSQYLETNLEATRAAFDGGNIEDIRSAMRALRSLAEDCYSDTDEDETETVVEDFDEYSLLEEGSTAVKLRAIPEPNTVNWDKERARLADVKSINIDVNVFDIREGDPHFNSFMEELLTYCPKVESLTMPNIEVGDELAEALKRLSNLKAIGIVNDKLSDEAFAEIVEHTQLTDLACEYVNDARLAAIIEHAPGLNVLATSLDGFCGAGTPKALSMAGASDLEKLTKLEHITAYGVDEISEDIQLAILTSLCKLPALTSFDLDFIPTADTSSQEIVDAYEKLESHCTRNKAKKQLTD